MFDIGAILDDAVASADSGVGRGKLCICPGTATSSGVSGGSVNGVPTTVTDVPCFCSLRCLLCCGDLLKYDVKGLAQGILLAFWGRVPFILIPVYMFGDLLSD